MSNGSTGPGGSAVQSNPTATIIQHPKLPSKASMYERIFLGVGINLLFSIVTDPAKLAEFTEYLTPIRDALNQALPPGE